MRAVLVSALVVSAWLSTVMAGGGDGRLGYHTRNETGVTAAPYLEWADSAVDLPAGFPAFVPLPVGTALEARQAAARSGYLATLPWGLCLSLAAFFVIRIGRRARLVESVTASAALAFGCAAMLATSTVWTMHASARVTMPVAQMDALRRLVSGRAAVFDLTSRRRLRGADAWTMQIDLPVRRAGRGSARGPGRSLAVLPRVPPGSYLLTTTRHGGGEGLLMVGVGNDQFAIVTQPLAAFDGGLRIDLPAGARALTIRGDEVARDGLDAVQIRPLDLDFAAVTRDLPRRAVRYGPAVAFFLDDRAYAEPSGFWVAGARETQLVLAPDSFRGPQALLLRNAPVENTVTLEISGRRETIVLAPGEERRIDVPIDPARGAALVGIGASAGFRPSELDPNNRDTRMLGVYVRVLIP
jgi:hypothetical protein